MGGRGGVAFKKISHLTIVQVLRLTGQIRSVKCAFYNFGHCSRALLTLGQLSTASEQLKMVSFQLRLDFVTFVITGPNTRTTSVAKILSGEVRFEYLAPKLWFEYLAPKLWFEYLAPKLWFAPLAPNFLFERSQSEFLIVWDPEADSIKNNRS